jgi:hypothetical protein
VQHLHGVSLVLFYCHIVTWARSNAGAWEHAKSDAQFLTWGSEPPSFYPLSFPSPAPPRAPRFLPVSGLASGERGREPP